jgi:PAS domain S-box-containing protein
MIRIVYIGEVIEERINILKKIEDSVIDIIDVNNEIIINKLPNDVIDLFIINKSNRNLNICQVIKTNKRLLHIPVITLVNKVENDICLSDIIVSPNTTNTEFFYQVKTLIKMKLIDDELKKEKILLELKVKDRTNELENKAERLRITFNSIGDGVIVTNETGIIISMNPVAMKMCEFTKDDFILKNIDDIFDIWKNGEKIKIFKLIKNTLKTYFLSDDMILKTKGGKEYIVSDSASPMINKDGNLMGIVVVFRDNTDEYHMKKELINSEERFRNMFDNMKSAVAIYQTNDNGKTFFFNGWNKRAKELEKINEIDILGKTLEETFPLQLIVVL